MTTGVRGYAISPAGGLTELAGSPFVYASGRTFEIEIAPGGRRVFVLDLDNGIAAFDVAPDGGLALIEGSPFAVGDFSAAMELSPDGSFLYLGSSYYTGINGFVVGPDGAPSPIGDGIPSEIPVELIAPPGAHELVSVRSSPGDIVAYAIAGDGALTQLSDPTAVVDEAHRVPDGAVFVASNCLTSAIDAAVLCDDGHACTADLCDLARGCVNGDANLDASGFSADRVDGRDLVVLADAWNSCPGDLSYAAAANLDQTGCVDVTDFHLFMMAFGRTCP